MALIERIKLERSDFEVPDPIHYTQDKDVILGIRLFNKTLAQKVMKQILQDQETLEKTIKHLDKKINEIDEMFENLTFEEENQHPGPMAARGVLTEIKKIMEAKS